MRLHDPALLAQALAGTPYSVKTTAAAGMLGALREVEDRVTTLRSSGRLSPATLRRYYGAKRFEQVAESNAIEGSTLSAGETKLAVLKGVTLTGHDPAHVRDAIALDRALQRVAELARERGPTRIADVQEIHGLLLGDRPGAGVFRTEPVRLSGSSHRPPKTWAEVMSAMEGWERWSLGQASLPAPLRATVLHAWLTHVHTFIDGNGRTARAISNLELVRAGFPPIIVRKTQDRTRYIDALHESDEGGDIAPFLDLVLDRLEGAVAGLVEAARREEGYDPVAVALRQAQERRLAIWSRSVELFFAVLRDRLAESFEAFHGRVGAESFVDALALDDYIDLCSGRTVSRSWAFRVVVSVPGLSPVERLAWVGYRTAELRKALHVPSEFAPSLFWSTRNREGYPPWTRSVEDAPGLAELSISTTDGDEWHALTTAGEYRALSTVNAASAVADGFVRLVSEG